MSVSFGDYVYGAYKTTSGVLSTQVLLKTEALDFGLGGLKSIMLVDTGIDLSGASTAIVEVMLEYRNSRIDAFATTSWIKCDPHGVAYPLVTALEFKVNVRASDITDFAIDSIRFVVKQPDRRFGRSDVRAFKAGFTEEER
jgi:hypothetical protein